MVRLRNFPIHSRSAHHFEDSYIYVQTLGVPCVVECVNDLRPYYRGRSQCCDIKKGTKKQDIQYGSEGNSPVDLQADAKSKISNLSNVDHNKVVITVPPIHGSWNWIQTGPLAIALNSP